MTKNNYLPASYKDPSGYVFRYKNKIFRQINPVYKKNYDLLIKSGLYKKLTDEGLMVTHDEKTSSKPDKNAYKIIEPRLIPFISYPYEWSFTQLKDAALTTLEIQKIALTHGMSLKDASSFNIQYLSGKPVFIDTLSFEKYNEGSPWVAYRQFCEHFLNPLALASYVDIRFIKLLELNIDGIPMDFAVKMLPFKSRLRIPLLLHIFFHAKSYNNSNIQKTVSVNKKTFSRNSLLGLIDNLEDGIKSLNWNAGASLWSQYYTDTDTFSYEDSSLISKKTLVEKYLKYVKPKVVWDIGGNTGMFSRIAQKLGIFTVSMDNDPIVVEQNYRSVKNNKEKFLLPLWIDLTMPSPSLGWDNNERDSLYDRPHPDTIMALALIHHLAIGKNIPLSKLAVTLSTLCKSLIIEFVPKNDEKVQILLRSREDIFSDYNTSAFEKAFSRYFEIKEKKGITGSGRILYLMICKGK